MSIWRSVMAARASLFSAHSLPSSRPLNSRILVSTELYSSQNPRPRFFCQASDSEPSFADSPEMAGENGGGSEDGFFPAGSVEEEYQNLKFGGVGNALSEGFVAGDEESVGVDEERFEEFLSLLRSSPGGESLRSSFDGMGLTVNEEFAVRVIETPELSIDNLISFLNWALKNERKPEFKATSRVVDSLVAAVCSGGLSKRVAYSLWDLVKEIGENKGGVLNAESLNELIALLSKLGKAKTAVEVFEKFGDFGVVPNVDTYYLTVEALCRRSMYDWAWSFCEKMIEAEKMPDGEKVGKIISWLCKGKRAKDAHLVYTLAMEKKQSPPRHSVNFLIGSLSRDDDTVRLALEMLEKFEGEARKYAIKPFSAVIQGLCWAKDANEAKKLLVKMTTDGPPPGNAVFNSVIHGLSKVGEMAEAVETMKMMKRRGLKPDLYTYTVLISGYANGGQMAEACKVLAEAKKKHSKLSPVMYHSLIRGYCKLEAFDKALALLADTENHGVQANADEYNKLIQSLCLKALDWETAEKLFEEMKEKGLYLNGITRGLIRAVKEMVEEDVEAAKI